MDETGHEDEEPIDDALLREAASRALTCVACGDADPGAEGIAGAVLVSHIATELLAAREALRAADALAEAAESQARGESGECMLCGGGGPLAAVDEHEPECPLTLYRAARGAR